MNRNNVPQDVQTASIVQQPLGRGKQQRLASQPVDSLSVSRRLQAELMSLMSATVYEELTHKLTLKFPTDYPFKPPSVKFDTLCFHPNVDQYGNFCLDMLQDKWSSACDVRTILLSIQSLLGEPNNDSPLNSYAAALWSDQEEYKKVMQKQYWDAGGALSR